MTLLACDETPAASEAPPMTEPAAQITPDKEETSTSAPLLEQVERPPYKIEGVERVVAIGDVHGDFEALRAALFAARLTDADGLWIGQKTVLVQTGDLLDRGDQEQEIMDYLDGLGEQARAQGGQILEIIGNHEAMNVQGDLRYVTPGGFADFEDVEGLDLDDPSLAELPEQTRARRAAFVPGGPYARKLAEHNTIGIVNDTVFAHGGVLPEHVSYGIEKLNDEVSAWMLGQGEFPEVMNGRGAPTWTRYYSAPKEDPCPRLKQTLDALGAKRMVVGHTPQLGGVASSCDGMLWMVDVGMASHYGGKPAALEIMKDGKTEVMVSK